MLNKITPVILTFNEAENIERTLTAVNWAKEVLVVDSYSTDDTLSICQNFDNVTIIQRTFDSASQQCNFALDQDIQTEWILSMDADYVVTQALANELGALEPKKNVSGFEISFNYLINGKKLNASLYPPRLSLYRKQKAHYIQDGHTQRVIVDGVILKLNEKMDHDDRKPHARWLQSQRRYALMEAEKIKEKKIANMSWSDRVRLVGLGPLMVVPYTLFLKGLVFDGWPGLTYTRQRFVAECYLLFARLGLIKDE